jgi:signal transduction histidine kinase
LETLLADVLRDPDLALCFVTSTGTVIDGAGAGVALPQEDDERAVTQIGDDAGPIGFIGHRRSLYDDGSLLADVLRAARSSFEYARLQAELRVQLVAIQRSRARLVEATDAERRRIERDLHDGAQQRLVALALRVRTEQRRHAVAPGTAVDCLLSATVDELQAAVAELRSLTQGMLPAALASGGAAPALRELVARYDGRVRLVAVPDHRHVAMTEATVWFVASEGLTNATKHAPDASVTLGADCRDGVLHVTVCDDGPGGATLSGSGLRGLADRVDACGGQLTLRSARDGGTELTAVLPCA